MNLIEKVKIVEAIAPQAGAAITGDYVSLKKAGHVTVVVDIAQGYAISPPLPAGQLVDWLRRASAGYARANPSPG